MPALSVVFVLLGLIIFETISSLDNAVVNADVLSTVSVRSRRWFLLYGVVFAVFVVRGVLPLLIVYFSTPSITLLQAFTATLTSEASVKTLIEAQSPIFFAGGGIFLILLFFNWLFLEKKEYAFFLERHIHRHYSFWFYTLASAILLFIVWATIKVNPLISLGAVAGSSTFFLVSGFRKNAEEKEKEILKEEPQHYKLKPLRPHEKSLLVLSFILLIGTIWFAWHAHSLPTFGLSLGLAIYLIVVGFRKYLAYRRHSLVTRQSNDLSKLLYLELIDSTFSIDGVLGAFAFTMSVPLILLGNGIGAMVVRYFTVNSIKTVQKYAYLKNGGMYSIGLLGIIMVLESFGHHVALWMPPLITLVIVGFFFYISHEELKAEKLREKTA